MIGSRKTTEIAVLALMTGLLAFAIAGCSGGNPTDTSDNVSNGNENSSPSVQVAPGTSTTKEEPVPSEPAANASGYIPGTVDVENRTYRNDSLDLTYTFAPTYSVAEGTLENEECYAVADDRYLRWTFTYAFSGADKAMVEAYAEGVLEQLRARGDGLDYQLTTVNVRGRECPAIVVEDVTKDPSLFTYQVFVEKDGHVGIVTATAPTKSLAHGMVDLQDANSKPPEESF